MFLNNLFNISLIPANIFYELSRLNLAKIIPIEGAVVSAL